MAHVIFIGFPILFEPASFDLDYRRVLRVCVTFWVTCIHCDEFVLKYIVLDPVIF